MTYYHKSKEAALDAASKYEGDWIPRASFEPGNGWVIVLSPRSKAVFRLVLEDLLDEVELDLTGIYLLRRRPEEYKPPTPIERAVARQPRQPGQAPAPRVKMEVQDVAPGTYAPPWAQAAAPAAPIAPQPAAAARPAALPPQAAPMPPAAPKAPSGPPSAPQPLIKAPWQK